MFDFVRRHNRILQFALVLLIFPSFVLFGIQGYQRFSEESQAAATVAGRDITRAELESAHRSQVERMRAQMPGLDVKLFDTPEMRQRVLDELVRERVTMEAAHKLMLAPTDEQLLRTFQTDPQFASLRNSDGTVRKELLAARGVTSEQFVAQLKQDLSMRQVFYGIGSTVIPTDKMAQQALSSMFQQREVQITRFPSKDFSGKVTLSDADLQAYYDDAANAAQFQSREQAQVEYVVLDLEAVSRSIQVPDDELRKYYQENRGRYTQAEERRARHILVKADKGAADDEKAKARAKAEAMLAELRKNRAAFADLARARSDDPGSAAQGGDLDWFGRGAMTKPFEEAAFALKKGELSGVVESDFGFHLIEVTDARGGDTRSFEAVRAEIEAEVKKQLAQKRYAEAAEQFTDAVEQDDKLQAIADKLKLEVRKADGVSRQALPGAVGPLAQAKFLEALFTADVLAGKRNTGAIEVGSNQLVAGHVQRYSAPRKQPLAEVKDLVRAQLTARRSAELARKEGAAKLAEWQKSDAAAAWPGAVMLSRAKTAELPKPVVDAALQAAPERLPALVGVDLGDEGYAVVKVLKVGVADPAVTGDPAKVREQYAQLWAQAESGAYYRALKDRFGVKIKAEAMVMKSASTD